MYILTYLQFGQIGWFVVWWYVPLIKYNLCVCVCQPFFSYLHGNCLFFPCKST